MTAMIPVVSSFDAAQSALRVAFAREDAALRIVDETGADVGARELLLDAAFGAARFGKTSERLREGRLPAAGLALVAKDGDEVVGTIRLWHVRTGDGRPALMLGPLAVAESHRSLGVGGQLMREAMWRAAARGHKAILLVGDEAYYRRFGFERALTRGLDLPGPVDRARFLGFEIEPGALAGASGLVAPTGAHMLRRAPRAPAMTRAA
ncbi:MAG: N-acetyltransferase [Rhizobiales bacterium]|nr:N-acetyltransferase [Hyphomicrobiales bacterium]